MKKRGRWFGLNEAGPKICYNPIQWLVSTAKGRAKKRGLAFDITLADLTIPEVCPYLKTKFIPKTMYAMSLDRIDNTKGYIKGNVEIVSRKANLMKSDANIEELMNFAFEVLDRYY